MTIFALFVALLAGPSSNLDSVDPGRQFDSLADLAHHAGLYRREDSLLQTGLALRVQRTGMMHPDVARSLDRLGQLRSLQKRDTLAKRFLGAALEIRRTKMVADHPDLVASEEHLGTFLVSRGAPDSAEPILRSAIASRLGRASDSLQAVESLLILSDGFVQCGKYQKAASLRDHALELLEAKLGLRHPRTVALRNELPALHVKARAERNAREEEDLRHLESIIGTR